MPAPSSTYTAASVNIQLLPQASSHTSVGRPAHQPTGGALQISTARSSPDCTSVEAVCHRNHSQSQSSRGVTTGKM
eukprot:354111-Chlamydomonas_euryale.AAC.2